MEVNMRGVTSSAVLEEKLKLRKEFKYLDMIFYTLAALIGLDTIGAFASYGAQSLTWLVISAINSPTVSSGSQVMTLRVMMSSTLKRVHAAKRSLTILSQSAAMVMVSLASLIAD